MRKNIIVIFGIVVDKRTDLLNKVLHNLNNLLEIQIGRCDINNIYLMEKKGTDVNPIVLEFVLFLGKQALFKNFKKMKGTGVAIANETSYEDRINNKVLTRHFKQAKDQQLSARIRGFSLDVENKLYSVEELKELEEKVLVKVRK
ncbi:unnamed protein product [Psylliodes chrysocephalus]|uniref:Uncharacterized protein n=1 Tax=Psylliodes chrysocephalus TaxID=3402493 RepID=A0A9P0GJD7_9CUCU|nr:unnamed protein product [Psylliodes chrysocephala]